MFCSAYPDGEKTGFPDPLALRSIQGEHLQGGAMPLIDSNDAEFLSAIRSFFVADDKITTTDIKSLKKVIALYHLKQKQWAEDFDSLYESTEYFRESADQWKEEAAAQKHVAELAINALQLSAEILDDRKPINRRGAPSKEKTRKFLLKAVTGYKDSHGTGHKKKTGRKMSDRDALIGFFKEFYKREGMRESRVDSADFQRKVKTYLNNIADARSDLKREEKLLKLALRENPDK